MAAEVDSCTGACLADWSPLLIGRGELQLSAAPEGVDAQVGAVTRPDGARQAAYDGQALYRWAGDRAPGEAGAQGKDGRWFVADVTPTVRVYAHPDLGDILVGPNGMTLYTFAYDGADEVRCEDSCSENWRPLVISYRPAAAPRLEQGLTTLQRGADEYRAARLQVSYKGKPLYYWSRDVRPGDATGDGIGGLWSVVRP